jgi:hypothetical protein
MVPRGKLDTPFCSRLAGLIHMLLRGAILVSTSLVLGGVAWLRLLFRAAPHARAASSAW